MANGLSGLGSWRPGTSVPDNESLERLIAEAGPHGVGPSCEAIEVDAIERARHPQLIDRFSSLPRTRPGPVCPGNRSARPGFLRATLV